MKDHTCVVKTTQVVLGLYVEFTTHVWEKHLCYVFLKLFPSHFFRMTPKNVCMGRCVVAIIAFVWLLLCCAFSNVSSKPIQSCICLTFPRDMFWNIPSDCLSKWMQNHTISCICLSFPRCVFSNVSSNDFPKTMHNHIVYIFFTFLQSSFLSLGLLHWSWFYLNHEYFDSSQAPTGAVLCVIPFSIWGKI